MTLGCDYPGMLIPDWVSLERHVLDCILVSVRSVRRHVKACHLHPCRGIFTRVIKNYRTTPFIFWIALHCNLLRLFQQAFISLIKDIIWTFEVPDRASHLCIKPFAAEEQQPPPHNHCVVTIFHHSKYSKDGDFSDALEFETCLPKPQHQVGLPDVPWISKKRCRRVRYWALFWNLLFILVSIVPALSCPRSNLAAFSTSGKRMGSTSAPRHEVLALEEAYQVSSSIRFRICIPIWYVRC